MGTVEIVPDLLATEAGSRTLGGGAGSSLAALNDGLDTTYLTAAGTLAQNYVGYFRFAAPTLPSYAAIRHIQLKIRYSHFTRSSTTNEYWLPLTVLVGRLAGGKHVYDAYTTGERWGTYSTSTSVQEAIFPMRPKDWSGKFFMGERAQMLPGRSFYGVAQVYRKTAINLARIYSMSLIVTYDEKPVVTLLNPSGGEVVARPPVDWTFADPDGQPQVATLLRIFTAAQVAQPLFTPEPDSPAANKFKPVYEIGLYSAKYHHDLRTSLENGGSYRAYLRSMSATVWVPGIVYFPRAVGVLYTGLPLAPVSDWAYQDFTVNVSPPLKPTLTVGYDQSIHGLVVTVQGQDNLLPWGVSTFETSTLDAYLTSTNTTLTRSIAQFLNGSASLQLTRTTSTGDANVAYPSASNVRDGGMSVDPGMLYTANCYFKAGSTSRTCRVNLTFYDKNGTAILSTVTYTDCVDNSTGWREAYATATAPASAAFVRFDAKAIGAVVGEVHYVDQLGIFPGQRTNLLTQNQANFTTGTTGWAAGSNTTIAFTTTQSWDGAGSMMVTRTGSTGDAQAGTPTGASGFPIMGSTQWTVGARFRADSVPRNCLIVVGEYDSGGALVTTYTTSTVADLTTDWVTVSGTFTVGSTVNYLAMTVSVQGCAAGESHYVDGVGIWPGTVVGDHLDINDWSQGGFVHDDPDDHQMFLQRSLHVDEDGDDIWEDIPEPRVTHDPELQMLTYVDYEMLPGETPKYRARIESLNGVGDMLNSGWCKVVDYTLPATTTWWIRDPLMTSRSMAIRVVECRITTPKPNSVDYPIGATAAVMTHDGVKKDKLAMTIDLLDQTAYDKFRAMISSGSTLYLQSTHNQDWYVQADDGIEYDVMRAAPLPTEIWTTRHFHRVSINFISVEKPLAWAAVPI